jgi:hypothetical protein
MLEHNPNWQDTVMGEVILGGFVVIAVIAASFMIFAPSDPQTAGKLSFSVTIGLSSWRPAPTTPATP